MMYLLSLATRPIRRPMSPKEWGEIVLSGVIGAALMAFVLWFAL